MQKLSFPSDLSERAAAMLKIVEREENASTTNSIARMAAKRRQVLKTALSIARIVTQTGLGESELKKQIDALLN